MNMNLKRVVLFMITHEPNLEMNWLKRAPLELVQWVPFPLSPGRGPQNIGSCILNWPKFGLNLVCKLGAAFCFGRETLFTFSFQRKRDCTSYGHRRRFKESHKHKGRRVSQLAGRKQLKPLYPQAWKASRHNCWAQWHPWSHFCNSLSTLQSFTPL